jgi:VanZ family protein
VLASFAIAVLGIAFELLHAFIQGRTISPENVLADLFGVVCGILLGMNIRVMRNSA